MLTLAEETGRRHRTSRAARRLEGGQVHAAPGAGGAERALGVVAILEGAGHGDSPTTHGIERHRRAAIAGERCLGVDLGAAPNQTIGEGALALAQVPAQLVPLAPGIVQRRIHAVRLIQRLDRLALHALLAIARGRAQAHVAPDETQRAAELGGRAQAVVPPGKEVTGRGGIARGALEPRGVARPERREHVPLSGERDVGGHGDPDALRPRPEREHARGHVADPGQHGLLDGSARSAAEEPSGIGGPAHVVPGDAQALAEIAQEPAHVGVVARAHRRGLGEHVDALLAGPGDLEILGGGVQLREHDRVAVRVLADVGALQARARALA